MIQSCTGFICQTSPNAILVKAPDGFDKYKKWAKVDTYFSFIKPSKQEILHFLRPLSPRFCAKKNSIFFQKANVAIIIVNAQKSMMLDDECFNGQKKLRNG